MQNKIQSLQKKDISQNTSKFLNSKPYKKLNFLLALSFVTIPYYIGKKYWPMLETWIPNPHKRIIFTVSLFEMPTISISFIFYTVLYLFKIPFFESFKSNNLPWPWEKNKKKWKKALKKIILIYLINLILLGETFAQTAYYFSKTSSNSKNFPSL